MEILRISANEVLRVRGYPIGNIVEYGYLYNDYATNDVRGFVSGWHIPSRTEYYNLAVYLGGQAIAGKKLKEIGFIHWYSPNSGTNDVGFNGVGGGVRNPTFSNLKTQCHFGTSTPAFPIFALSYNQDSFYEGISAQSNGRSIRLLKDDSIDPGSVVIDGITYQTVTIGTQVWITANLMSKRFANGDPIPEITDKAAWTADTTGARCSYNNLESNAGTVTYGEAILRYEAPVITLANSIYGMLYNWYAVNDPRNICPVGWRMPIGNDFEILKSNIGSDGNKLKELGLTYWLLDLGTNDYGFNGRGSGSRNFTDGLFVQQKTYGQFWVADDPSSSSTAYYYYLYSNNGNISFFTLPDSGKSLGNSIRLIKDSSINTGSMIGTDGLKYNTVKIGNQVWMSENYKTTKYRNGDWIEGFNSGTYTPISNAAWAALTTGALCAYNDDLLNV